MARRSRLPLALIAALAVTACSPEPSTDDATPTMAATPAKATVKEIASLSAPTPGLIDVRALGTPGRISATSEGRNLGDMILSAEGDYVVGQVATETYGPQTFCLDDVCGRVSVKDPDAQTPEEALDVAEEVLIEVLDATGAQEAFPNWTFQVEGQRMGAGGSANLGTETLTLYATPGRTSEEYALTVLHEIGHIIDFEWMDDAARAEYRAIRDIPHEVSWWPADGEHAVGVARWDYVGEDFAEVMAALLTGGAHIPRTANVAHAPTEDDLQEISELIPTLPALTQWASK